MQLLQFYGFFRAQRWLRDEASTRVGAVDATVDYFWSWAKWPGTRVWLQLAEFFRVEPKCGRYMIRKHEPPEDAVGFCFAFPIPVLY